MKKRKICQLCAVWVLILVGLFSFGEEVFKELSVSRCEQVYQEGDTAYIAGKIYKKEETCLYLENIQYRMENHYVAAEERLPVYLSEVVTNQLPEIGRTVLIKGSVKMILDAPNPGNFNQKFYYQRQNIHIIVYDAQIIGCRGSVDVWKETLWRVRQKLSEKILNQMGEKSGGVLCAMLLGETSYLEQEIKELFQKSGIGHLLAVSGLHMSFWGTGIYEIAKKIRVPKNIAGVLSILFLSVYVIFSGASVSAVRAYLMFCVRMGAVLAGREYDGMTSLALAALIQLFTNPLQLFDAGFLLSFGAVLGIYVISPMLQERVGMKLSIPLALQIILFPVMLYFYYEICIYSLVWNLAAVPLASAVLVCGAFGMVTSVPFFFTLTEGMIWFYEKGSEFFLQLPGARWVAGQPELIQILLYCLFLGGALYLLQKKKSHLSVSILIGASLLLTLPQQYHENLEITMVNVGQGDCFVLREKSGKTCLIDGGSSTVSSVGTYRIEPFLKSQGIGMLDYVFVTHGDEDHLNGIMELIERHNVGVRIERLVLPPQRLWEEKLTTLAQLAAEKDILIYVMEQGKQMQVGDVEILCLWPSDIVEESGNEASLVLSVSYESFDMLFTGDLEKESEAVVCEYIEEKQRQKQLSTKYEVLKIGHHGSRYATSEALLELLRTDAAFVSAGEKNRYGHPHEEVLLRLANHGINLYNTKDGSAVKICTDGEKYYILEP